MTQIVIELDNTATLSEVEILSKHINKAIDNTESKWMVRGLTIKGDHW
jgi:hypothetical protein